MRQLPPCATGLSCIREDRFDEGRRCRDLGRTEFTECNAFAEQLGVDTCATGLFCRPDFCDPLQGRDLCVPARNEGRACDSDFEGLGCARCDPGLECIGDPTTGDQRCRRRCRDAADCPCGQYHCVDEGFCVECAETGATCGNTGNPDSGECCDALAGCYAIPEGTASVCCRPDGVSCVDDPADCCPGTVCDVGGTCRATPNFDGSGDMNCAWGDGACLPCVSDVIEALGDLRNAAHSPARFDANVPTLGPYPPRGDQVPVDVFPGHSHFQSVVRLPFIAEDSSLRTDGRWVVMSKSGSPGVAIEPLIRNTGLYFVHLDRASLEGEPWAFRPDPLGWVGALAYYYDFYEPGLNHFGGMQAIGTVLAVAVEDNADPPPAPSRPAEVRFFDVSAPGAVSEIMRLRLDGSRGEPNQSETHSRATAVAVSRLRDGRYLIFVGGRSHSADGWFYVTDSPALNASTRWRFIQYWTSETSAGAVRWHLFDNLTFLNECETGDIFLFGMGENGSDVMSLYKLGNAGDGTVDFDWLSDAEFDATGCDGLNPGVSMRWGAGIYVTQSRTLAAYAVSRNVEDTTFQGQDDTVCFNQWPRAR